MSIDRELLAKANAGDTDAMLDVGFAYYREQNFAKVEEFWTRAAEKGDRRASYHLLRGLYGIKDAMPSIPKFCYWLNKAADPSGLDSGWARIMLGALRCGAMREGWVYAFDVEVTNGSFHILEGIDFDPAEGIRLVENGMKVAEERGHALDNDDYDAIAKAWNNRFQHFRKNNIEQSKLYPAGYEPLDDLRQSIKYIRKCIEVFPENHPNRDLIIEANNRIIAITEKEIASWEAAIKAKQDAVNSLDTLLKSFDEGTPI